MKIIVSPRALEELAAFVRHEPKTAAKVLSLIEECARSPFAGRGKPEPLRHDLSGCWSRRVTEEHRLVYRVGDDAIEVVLCRAHY